MRTRRIAIALVAATGLILSMAAPVAAKKPPKPVPPEDPPELVEVTMTGSLATTCADGDGLTGVLVMERDAEGLAPLNLGILELDIPGVDTSRQYPDPGISDTELSGFSGCHGEQVDDIAASPYGGLFITLDDTGAVTDLLWHFDYYLEMTTRGKREVMAVMEHFTLSGHELAWDADTSTASGWFNVRYHLEDRANHVSVGYEPVDGSPVFLVLTLTMTSHG